VTFSDLPATFSFACYETRETTGRRLRIPTPRWSIKAMPNDISCDLDTSVPDWLIDYPASAPVFQELRIDTSCGGKSLRYVCEKQELDPTDVLARLRRTVDR